MRTHGSGTAASTSGPGLVFITVLVFHLSISTFFGVTWDEPLHLTWGRLFASFVQTGDMTFVQRMPGLGMYYGPAFHLLNFAVTRLLTHFLLVPSNIAIHVLTILTFAGGCAGTYSLARDMCGARVAALSVIFLASMPQLVAHAQYNPKDVPMMSAIVLCYLAARRFFHRPSRSRAALAGCAFGIAFSVKLSAVIALPSLLAACGTALWGRRDSFDPVKTAADCAIAATCCMLTIAALWPSLLFDPGIVAGGFRAFSLQFFTHPVLYLGRQYAAADLPWHYVPAMLALTTPIPPLVCCGIGAAVAVRRARATPTRVDAVLLLSWLVWPLCISTAPHLTRYDGYRQFFFTLPAIAILAALGFDRLLLGLYSRLGGARAAVAAATACVACSIWLIAELVVVFPYGGSYFNQLARYAWDARLDHTLEVELWGAPYMEGVRWLNAHAEPFSVVCVPIAGHLVSWYARRTDIVFQCNERSEYVMYINRRAFMDDWLSEVDSRPAVFGITRAGATLLTVHRLDATERRRLASLRPVSP